MIVTDRYTKVSNRFFELVPEMKGSVTKIVLAYLRASTGHHRDHAFMSFTDLERATGLKRNTVNTALKDAIGDHYLAVDPDRKGFNGKTCYIAGEKLLSQELDESQSQKVTVDDSHKIEPNICDRADSEVLNQSIGHEIEPVIDKKSDDQNMTSSEIGHEIELPGHITEPEKQMFGHEIELHIKEKDFKEKNLKENISLDERVDEFLSDLDNLFTDDSAETEVIDPVPEPATETSDTPQQEPAWDKPYTQAEYEHFKDRVSLTALSSDVYNPCHNTSHARSDFQQPTKSYSNWQQLVAVVEAYFPTHSIGYAMKIAQQLAGTAKSGQRKDFEINPPMDAVEACAFAYWLREGERLEQLPERSERIQERAMQFRALNNHFEHVNYARYTLAELMESHENADSPEPDPNLFEPAPDDVLEQVYADAEALLGFSLSGDF